MAKPSTLPRWANLANPADIVDPPSGKKDTGWLTAEKPPHSYFNWFMNLVYLWAVYLDGLTGEALTWTAAHVHNRNVTFHKGADPEAITCDGGATFTAASGATALTATAAGPGTAGLFNAGTNIGGRAVDATGNSTFSPSSTSTVTVNVFGNTGATSALIAASSDGTALWGISNTATAVRGQAGGVGNGVYGTVVNGGALGAAGRFDVLDTNPAYGVIASNSHVATPTVQVSQGASGGVALNVGVTGGVGTAIRAAGGDITLLNTNKVRFETAKTGVQILSVAEMHAYDITDATYIPLGAATGPFSAANLPYHYIGGAGFGISGQIRVPRNGSILDIQALVASPVAVTPNRPTLRHSSYEGVNATPSGVQITGGGFFTIPVSTSLQWISIGGTYGLPTFFSDGVDGVHGSGFYFINWQPGFIFGANVAFAGWRVVYSYGTVDFMI